MIKEIFCTYSTITPESAEQGDTADHGWYDNGFKYTPENKPETGHSCEPDRFDLEDGLTAVDLAVRHLRDKGVIGSSASHFHPDVWYFTEYETEDYTTAEQVEYSFHLEGFTDSEQEVIFERMKSR